MASNSEDRNTRRQMKLFEEDELDRRLKAAGIYERHATLEEKKKLLKVIQESCEQSKYVSDEELNENIISSTKQQGKKHLRKIVETDQLSDDEDKFVWNPVEPSVVLPSTTVQNKLSAQKGLRTGGNPKKPVESRGTQILAAALKKSELTNNPVPSHSKDGDFMCTFDNTLTETTKPKVNTGIDESLDNEVPTNSRKSQITNETNSDIDDDEFPPILSIKDRCKPNYLPVSSGLYPVPKNQVSAMKVRSKQFAEQVLKKVEKCHPHPMLEVKRFDCRDSYKVLIDDEKKLKRMDQDSDYKFVKWRKPIILDTLRNRRKRPNLPTNTYSSPKYDVQGVDPLEIPDSPPTLSLRKLGISSVNPVLEPSASRNKSSRLNEVDDTELEDIFECKATSETNEETKDCPICGKSFSINEIEQHAAECGDFEDEILIEPQERITTRSTRLRNRNYVAPRVPGGFEFEVAGKSSPSNIETDLSENGKSSDSDFEVSVDSGNKRNHKKDFTNSKKRRM